MLHVALILFARSWAYSIFRFFRRMGPFGLLVLSGLDSSFLFLPFGNDLMLIVLVSAEPGGLKWILYVLMSAIGSVIGVLLIDLLMRKAGEEGLKKFLKPKRIEGLRKKMESSGGWAIMMATLIPPPFPFTPVVMVASALQYPRNKLLATVFAGRLVRYTFEALLAIYFGRKIIRYLNSPLVEYLVYGFIVIAIIGSTLSVMKWIRNRDIAKRKTGPQMSEAS